MKNSDLPQTSITRICIMQTEVSPAGILITTVIYAEWPYPHV